MKGVATSAFIMHENKVLLVRRNPNEGFLAGYWELPGGKVEAGESVEQGMEREVKEELGVACEVGKQFDSFTYTTRKGVHMTNKSFFVSIKSHVFILTEHDAHAWTAEKDLDTYRITAEMKACVKKGFRAV